MNLLVLLLALCLPALVSAQDTTSEQDSLIGDRRLRFNAGLGTQQALHAGLEWHMPLSQSGRHIFVPAMSLGVRLFEPVPVFGARITWLMIGRAEKRGGMIGLTATTESWGAEEDKRTLRIITLHPGVILRAGQSLLTLTAGAGPSFSHREIGKGERLSVTDETDIFYNVNVSFTYDLFD